MQQPLARSNPRHNKKQKHVLRSRRSKESSKWRAVPSPPPFTFPLSTKRFKKNWARFWFYNKSSKFSIMLAPSLLMRLGQWGSKGLAQKSQPMPLRGAE
ncbi:hypothetical protein AYI68_g3695 [Smittium mucronatum]|uniref:Uncharacterized protein n=1 Tax=Smittium mucronatum TaxID=133383 RepID=A0A1R0GZ71_9FUNG|nr:hypothetical protein AYI68_g3695 [Smittium mucronatum]